MPRIPTVEGTSVTQNRTPDARVAVSVTPEQLAGPEVRLLQQLGKNADEITDFVIQKQNAKDLAIVSQGEAALKEVLMEQKLEAQKKLGTIANGLLNKATNFFDSNMVPEDGQSISEAHQRYMDVYENADERQKAAIDVLRGNQRITHLKAIGSHETAQLNDAALKGGEASMNMDVVMGINGTTEERDMAIASIMRHANSIKEQFGTENETAMYMQKEKISAIHTGRLQKLTDAKDIIGAEEYFKKWKGEMIGDTSQIEKQIAARKVDVMGEGYADKAFRMWQKGKIYDAYDYIDAIKDPDIQQAARTQFDADIAGIGKARTELTYQAHQKINAALFKKDANGNFEVQNFSDMPQNELRFLAEQPGGTKIIKDYKDFFSIRDNPAEPLMEVQMKTYDFLMKSAKSKNPQERQAFAKLPIATSPNLGPKLKKHFMDLQAEILGKTSGSLLAKSDILGTHEGFFKLSADGNERTRFALQDEVNSMVLQKEEELRKKGNPRKASIDEYTEIVKTVYKPSKVQRLMKKNFTPTPPKPGKQVQPIDAHITSSIEFYDAEFKAAGVGDEDKERRGIRFKTKIYGAFDSIRTSNIAAGEPSEPTYKQRESVIKFSMGNKVMRDDTFTPDNEVSAILLTEEESETAYVLTPNGKEVLIKEIDKVEGEDLKSLQAYLIEKDLTWSYKDRARALEALGKKERIEKRRMALTTGEITTPDGNTMARDGIIDALMRNDVATLKSEETVDAMVSKYGKEIVPILNYVIRVKERAAR